MAKKKSPSVRTTLYRLHTVADLRSAIRSKYLDHSDFEATDTEVEGRDALLVVGRMASDQTKWAGRLSALADVSIQVGNVTAAAALLIRDESSEAEGPSNQAFALTYGMGFQLLDRQFIEQSFGIKVAVRTAAPEAIQSLTRTELDHRSKTDRSSIPAGEGLRGFGIADYGEIITRLSGEASLPGLKAGKDVNLRAADALSVPLGRTKRDLVADLDAISDALTLDPKPGLELIEQFVRVKDKDLLSRLNDRLRSALDAPESGRLAIGWPHERIDENGTPTSFRLRGRGRGGDGVVDGLPDLPAILKAISQKGGDALKAAKSIKVQLYRDAEGDEPISAEIGANHWLFFETELADRRYCFFESRWYQMDHDYAERLEAHIKELFARPAQLILPAWDRTQNPAEKDYNRFAAHEIGGVMLDQDLIKTVQSPRGFEACDIFSGNGDLIHIKHTPKSSAASHLVAQAVVSVNAIRFDEEAREKLRAKLVREGGHSSRVSTRPRSVVLGMARDRPVTADDLFTFTQVTIARLDQDLAAAGITLTVAPIQLT